jgi:hypothetical protein
MTSGLGERLILSGAEFSEMANPLASSWEIRVPFAGSTGASLWVRLRWALAATVRIQSPTHRNRGVNLARSWLNLCAAPITGCADE